MFFWSGFGFVIPLILIISVFIGTAVMDIVFGMKAGNADSWIVCIALSISTFSCWILGKTVLQTKKRILIDKDTHEEIELKTSHTFMFIPIRLWTYLLGCSAIGVIIVQVVRLF